MNAATEKGWSLMLTTGAISRSYLEQANIC